VAVIGAGVLGLAVAQALARKNRSLVLLERNDAFGRETSSRNSEVLHAGIHYPGTFLKSRLCVEGNRLLYAWCRDRNVPHRRIGKLIVAAGAGEEADLEGIRDRATANGVEGLTLLGRAEIRQREPDVAARAALLSPNTGIVDSHRLMASLLAAAEAQGALLACRTEVTALHFDGKAWDLTLNSGEYRIRTRTVINSAGLAADRVAALAGIDIASRDWHLKPCKGNYFTASPAPRLRRLVYPVPAKNNVSLGIHATLDLAGRVRFGPDSRYLDGPVGPGDYAVDEERREAFREAICRYLPGMATAELSPDMAGIRPKLQAPGAPPRDFAIQEESAAGLPGLVNLVGMESPGLSASLAIGRYVAALIDPPGTDRPLHPQ
jgi:L-2-hydroxyglutarate oxidase LhgO